MRKAWIYGSLGVAVVLLVALGVVLYNGLRLEPSVSPTTPPGSTPPPGKPSPGETAQSSCVACHRDLPQTFVGHTFEDWEGSLHAEQGISCHDCHGGDPTQQEAQRAHQNVRPSRDPESRLYFTRIPATCGECHTQELQNFKQSVHFTQLQGTGRGPNCITCHGSMAISIPQPAELSSTCAACHNERLGIRPDEPLKARFLLKLMQQTQEQLKLLRVLIELKKMQGVDTTAAETLLEQAQTQMSPIQEEWHTFQLEQLEGRLDRVRASIRKALDELGVTGG